MYFTSALYNSLDRMLYISYTVGSIYSSSFVPQADLNFVYNIMLPSQILQHTIKVSSDKTYTITT